MYTIGAPLIPFNSATPGVCPTDGSIHPSQDFAATDINTKLNQWEMTDDTQQPPLDRGCYLIGDLNSANLCPTAAGTTLLPPIPNGPNNPKNIGDLLDPLGVSWCHYSENFTTAEVDCSPTSTVSYKATGWNPHMQVSAAPCHSNSRAHTAYQHNSAAVEVHTYHIVLCPVVCAM